MDGETFYLTALRLVAHFTNRSTFIPLCPTWTAAAGGKTWVRVVEVAEVAGVAGEVVRLVSAAGPVDGVRGAEGAFEDVVHSCRASNTSPTQPRSQSTGLSLLPHRASAG